MASVSGRGKSVYMTGCVFSFLLVTSITPGDSLEGHHDRPGTLVARGKFLFSGRRDVSHVPGHWCQPLPLMNDVAKPGVGFRHGEHVGKLMPLGDGRKLSAPFRET